MVRACAAALALGLVGCTTTVRVPLASETGPGTMCWAPPLSRRATAPPRARPISTPERAELERVYGERPARLAELIGAAPALVDLEQLARSNAPAPVRRDTLDAVEDLFADVQRDTSATLAQLVCDRERVDLVLTEAHAVQNQRVGFLAGAATLVGAMTTVLAGALLVLAPNATTLQGVQGLIGGGLAGGIGIAQLLQHANVQYAHPDNALRDLWLRPAQSTFYPPIVWAFLTHSSSGAQGQAVRDVLVRQWVRAGWVGGAGSSDAALLFGAGGVYSIDQLEHRRHMLQQVTGACEMVAFELGALAVAVRRRHLLAPPSADGPATPAE